MNNQLQIGDILLVKYKYCLLSWLIRKLTKSNWNHCALVIHNNNILEYRGRKLELNHITKYIRKKGYEVKLLRFEGLSEKDKYNLWLMSYLIYPYICKGGYLKLLLTLFLLSIGYKGKLPRKTCSGLIAELFEQIGYYINLKKDSSRVTPEDINKRRGLIDVTKNLENINTCI